MIFKTVRPEPVEGYELQNSLLIKKITKKIITHLHLLLAIYIFLSSTVTYTFTGYFRQMFKRTETPADELYNSLKRGDISALVYQLKNNPNPESVIDDFRAILSYKNIPYDYTDIINKIIASGDTEALKPLLKDEERTQRVKQYQKVAHAINSGNVEMVQLVLGDVSKGYRDDPIIETSVVKAIAGGHTDIVQLLLNYNPHHAYGVNYLLYASAGGFTEIVKLLLQHYKYTPQAIGKALIAAARNNNVEIAALLLTSDAIIDTAVTKKMVESYLTIYSIKEIGDNALIIASQKGNQEMVELLLSHGANPEYVNKIASPKRRAIDVAATESIRLLLKK